MLWRSPSNLALIKYWGKHGQQRPRNASISFTLSKAYTEMAMRYEPKSGASGPSLSFLFEGEVQRAFEQKILAKLQAWSEDFCPFLKDYHLSLESRNSFPHSSGIASSASSMSALALCLCTMERDLGLGLEAEEDFWRKASELARLGSGSACRSVFGPLALWGEWADYPQASERWAIDLSTELHEVFRDYQNAILLVSKEEKSVSSTAGHALMEGHVFAQARYAQAKDNLARILPALRQGDLTTFIEVVEEEALSLHGLMFNSRPSYVLLLPQSLALVSAVRAWRRETGVPLCFSIDAGPNLHLLYPKAYTKQVVDFLALDEVKACYQDVLHDELGLGAVRLS